MRHRCHPVKPGDYRGRLTVLSLFSWQRLPLYLSSIHLTCLNWKFQHLFLGRFRDESIPDDQQQSWSKVCGGGRGDRRPSTHQIQALVCMVLTLLLTHFYTYFRCRNQALWNSFHHALSIASCPLRAWTILEALHEPMLLMEGLRIPFLTPLLSSRFPVVQSQPTSAAL